MRPGRVRPGRVRTRPRGATASPCFNEAGARTPRKRPWHRTGRCCRRPSFNEAGARTPRKRPRRGSPFGSRPGRFNEAGARTPRKSPPILDPWWPCRLQQIRALGDCVRNGGLISIESPVDQANRSPTISHLDDCERSPEKRACCSARASSAGPATKINLRGRVPAAEWPRRACRGSRRAESPCPPAPDRETTHCPDPCG